MEEKQLQTILFTKLLIKTHETKRHILETFRHILENFLLTLHTSFVICVIKFL